MLLGVPKVTANVYCKSRNLPNTDTQNYSTDLRYLLGRLVFRFKKDRSCVVFKLSLWDTINLEYSFGQYVMTGIFFSIFISLYWLSFSFFSLSLYLYDLKSMPTTNLPICCPEIFDIGYGIAWQTFYWTRARVMLMRPTRIPPFSAVFSYLGGSSINMCVLYSLANRCNRFFNLA